MLENALHLSFAINQNDLIECHQQTKIPPFKFRQQPKRLNLDILILLSIWVSENFTIPFPAPLSIICQGQ